MKKRQRSQLFVMCNEENIARYYKPAHPKLDQSFERDVRDRPQCSLSERGVRGQACAQRSADLRKDFGVGIGWINEGSYRRSCRHYFTQQFQEFRPNLHV